MNKNLKFVIAAFVVAVSNANAYSLGAFDQRLSRAELRCDDGRFVGWVSRDSDGYYKGGPAGNVSKNLQEVILKMLRDTPGTCT